MPEQKREAKHECVLSTRDGKGLGKCFHPSSSPAPGWRWLEQNGPRKGDCHRVSLGQPFGSDSGLLLLLRFASQICSLSRNNCCLESQSCAAFFTRLPGTETAQPVSAGPVEGETSEWKRAGRKMTQN